MLMQSVLESATVKQATFIHCRLSRARRACASSPPSTTCRQPLSLWVTSTHRSHDPTSITSPLMNIPVEPVSRSLTSGIHMPSWLREQNGPAQIAMSLGLFHLSGLPIVSCPIQERENFEALQKLPSTCCSL